MLHTFLWGKPTCVLGEPPAPTAIAKRPFVPLCPCQGCYSSTSLSRGWNGCRSSAAISLATLNSKLWQHVLPDHRSGQHSVSTSKVGAEHNHMLGDLPLPSAGEKSLLSPMTSVRSKAATVLSGSLRDACSLKSLIIIHVLSYI
jgi:hypothetical protein